MIKAALVMSSIAAVGTGCGTSANSGDALDVGGDDASSPTFFGSDASGAEGVDAFIEQGKVAVKVVAVSCAGDCVTVQAVGTGGFAPYSYVWEDGSTDPVRRLCPTDDGDYSVRVMDSGQVGENSTPPETARASVTADVLGCPDAGAPAGDAACDGGAALPPNGTYTGTTTSADLGGLNSGTITVAITEGSDGQVSAVVDETLLVVSSTEYATGSAICPSGAIRVTGSDQAAGRVYVYTFDYDPALQSLTGTWSYSCPGGSFCSGEPDGGGDMGTFSATLGGG